ncbi:MAG: PilZ domain-containing protein [Gammaproteobacteria bacterium]|nr:PilZ domain-containing protein [Gammaproteobacteria bacterium]
MNTDDRRHHSRIDFAATARIVGPDGLQAGRLKDISFKGALLLLDSPWQGEAGKKYILEFVLSGSYEVIRMAVTAAWAQDREVGLRCVGLDLESASHLRRLVELNLGSAELLERELESLSRGQ